MLEIIALYFLCKKMGEILRAKGWTKPVWMQIAVVAAWFVSMFTGALGYGVYLAIRYGPEAAENPGVIAYVISFLSAGLGVALLFLVAKFLPAEPASPPAPATK